MRGLGETPEGRGDLGRIADVLDGERVKRMLESEFRKQEGRE